MQENYAILTTHHAGKAKNNTNVGRTRSVKQDSNALNTRGERWREHKDTPECSYPER